MALLCQRGGLAGLKEAFGEHQDCDQRQEEDGVDLVALAVLCRHLVSRRLEDNPADCCDDHAEEDNGRRVVGDDLVDMADSSGGVRHRKILGDAENQQREGARRQKNEAGKNKDVNGSCNPVARMLPLSQPELQDSFQADQRPIKTKITFAANERRQALRHNVGEACEAQKIDDQEQDLT